VAQGVFLGKLLAGNGIEGSLGLLAQGVGNAGFVAVGIERERGGLAQRVDRLGDVAIGVERVNALVAAPVG
jgi:hypothetical protein